MRKKTIIVILLLIIPILLGITYYCSVKSLNKNKNLETEFYKVYDTGRYRNTYISIPADIGESRKEIKEYYESYIITNPPLDINALKLKIEEFEDSISYDEKCLNNSDCYKRIYIQESDEMPRDWKPTYFDSDEASHYDQSIIETRFYKETGEKIYKVKCNNEEIEYKNFIEHKQ